MQETKVCSKCKEEKSISEFTKRNTRAGVYPSCKKCVTKRCANYRVNNVEQYRISARKSATKCVNKLKDKVFAAYGNKCACCGETERKFLTLDHVNGGGRQHIEKYSNKHYQDAIKRNFPDDYQLLCYKCNCAKGFFGVCPHKEIK